MGQNGLKCNPTLCTLRFLHASWYLFIGLYQSWKSSSVIWLPSWTNGFCWISWWKPCLEGLCTGVADVPVLSSPELGGPDQSGLHPYYHMHRPLQCGLLCDCLERLFGHFNWNKKQRTRYCLVFAGWHIYISLVALYGLHLNFQMQFKLLILTYKAIYDLMRYLQNCISPLESMWPLWSFWRSSYLFPILRMSRGLGPWKVFLLLGQFFGMPPPFGPNFCHLLEVCHNGIFLEGNEDWCQMWSGMYVCIFDWRFA